MTKEIPAKGRDYREVLAENNRGPESHRVVIYLDGDDYKGELDLNDWMRISQILQDHPDLDRDTFLITETHDRGREGFVFSFAEDPEPIIGVKATNEVAVEPVAVPVPVLEKVEEPDEWVGKRFDVTARKKGNLGKPFTFVLVVDDPEKKIEEARGLVEIKMHTDADNVDITVRETDKDFVFRKAMADLRAGHFIDKKVADSDPRISREVTRQKERKSRNYR